MKSFFDAWQFLENHRIFVRPYGKRSHIFYSEPNFQESLSIMVFKDEETVPGMEIDLECGPWQSAEEWSKGEGSVPLSELPDDYLGHFMHDPKLDSYGNTFEEAIIQLAEKVHKLYGDEQFEW